MRLRVFALSGVLALLALPACSKKPTYYVIHTRDVKPRDLEITIAGKKVTFDAKDLDDVGSYGHYANAKFEPNTIDPKTTQADVSLDTPCGKYTFQVTPKQRSDEKSTWDVEITNDNLPKATHLLFDPSITQIDVGKTMTEIPKELDVRFGKCPRTIKVDGNDVTIPEVTVGKSVLVAATSGSCFVSGEVLFGSTADGCRPDSSKRLRGEATYTLDEKPIYLFTDVPMSTKVYSGKCTNSTFLQRCR